MYAPLIPLSELIHEWIAAARTNRRGLIELTIASVGLSLLTFGFSVLTGLTARETGIAIALGAILVIPYLAVSMVFNLAAHEMTQVGLGGKVMPLRTALENGLHKLISAIGIGLLQFVISIAAMAPFAIFLMLITGTNITTLLNGLVYSGSVFISILTALSVLAMLIVVVLVGIKIKFAVAALVADGDHAMAAIKSSWAMTSGRLWSVTWRMLVFAIITGVPLAMVNLVLNRIGGVTALMQQNEVALTLGQSLWSSTVDGFTVAVGMLAQAGFTMTMWKDLTRSKRSIA